MTFFRGALAIEGSEPDAHHTGQWYVDVELDGGGAGRNTLVVFLVQVVALVLGHVAALVLAHDRALAIYGSHRDATRSQVVMLIVMVCFTCLGLYLLSAANG